MNSENLRQILNELKVLSPIKAKKLKDMICQETNESDVMKQCELEQKIWNYLYQIFLSCLSKESKSSLVGAGDEINELIHTIEQKAQDGWSIYSEGAFRIEEQEGEYEVVGNIPREYGKGFLLQERTPKSEKEREYAMKELEFYTTFENHLAILGGEMDFKETYLTMGYQIKNSKISSDFVELLITTLELPRLDPEDVVVNQYTK
ncbi:MAG: hypothetical protein IKF71_04385 [Bacilli bacterium]|nr:hypothetical protein [Bacilli bacterium]